MTKAHRRTAGQLRVIGGQWRSRTIEVPHAKDLRPTPDRVRETLFNWLQPVIAGTRCLDLFCGSGILGLEALSRGACRVTFVDQNLELLKQLRRQLNCWRIEEDSYRLIQTDARAYLECADTRFDIAFVDPPYQAGGLNPCCVKLENNGWLAPTAWIYLETAAHTNTPELPPRWQLHRKGRAGQVRYYLAKRTVVGDN